MSDQKELVAASTATYRRVTIITTKTGFTFFWNGQQYNCLTLGEATAAIDAIYVKVAKIVLTGSNE